MPVPTGRCAGHLPGAPQVSPNRPELGSARWHDTRPPNAWFSCKHRKQVTRPKDAARSVGVCQLNQAFGGSASSMSVYL